MEKDNTEAKEKELAIKERELDKKEKELDKEKSKYLKISKNTKEIQKEFVGNTVKLVVSAFGLVAALAWNDLIKEFTKKFIGPIFGDESTLISQAIYALLVTALAVFVTYLLSKLAVKEESGGKQ